MMAHLGLFMVWQPFMQGGQRLKVSEVVLIALITIAILGFMNWWMLGLWVAVLSGIVGGKVFLFQARWLRLFYLTVFSYLVALLLLWIVPNGFPKRRSQTRRSCCLAQYGLPVLFAGHARDAGGVGHRGAADRRFLLREHDLPAAGRALVLGSFAFMTVGKMNYALRSPTACS